jgi:hypothetical protein
MKALIDAKEFPKLCYKEDVIPKTTSYERSAFGIYFQIPFNTPAVYAFLGPPPI